ncbi:unnamed protein product, partial [Mesorhabditis belari]|uniref:Zinc finger protein n=1 Tax=Mesorhabditis belari TaxID=2138241 RepID=A0AAF3F2D7_9BILA
MHLTAPTCLRRIINSAYDSFKVIPKPDVWLKRERQKRIVAWQFGINRDEWKHGLQKHNKLFHYMQMHRSDERKTEQFYAGERVSAALAEHHFEYKYFRSMLDKAHILLDNVVLSHLALYEPRTFHSLVTLTKEMAKKEGIPVIPDDKEFKTEVNLDSSLFGEPFPRSKIFPRGANKMKEETEGKEAINKKQRQGIGAQDGSKRREFRRFRRTNNGPKTTKASTSTDGTETVAGTTEAPKKQEKKPLPVCRFFRSKNGCLRGDACNFRHVPKKDTSTKKSVKDETNAASAVPTNPEKEFFEEPMPTIFVPAKFENKKFVPLKQVVSIEDRGSEVAVHIRKSEISYYRRRYLRCNFRENDEAAVIGFLFVPTEPEWSFAVREIRFTVKLPTDFPFESMLFMVNKVENAGMPDILCAHIEAGVKKFINDTFDLMKTKNAYEGMAKTLLRWIDRNIFQLFLEGLRRTKLVFDASAAGISLVYSGASSSTTKKASEEKEIKNVINLMSNANLRENERQSESDEEEQDSSSGSSSDDNDEHFGVEEDENEETGETQQPLLVVDSQPLARLPIEVMMVWNDFSKNIASISPVFFQLVVRCTRCSEHNDIEVPVKDTPKYRRCSRCNAAYSVRFRPEIAHENSNILAQCDARGCRPIDCVLLNSKLKFVCFACNKEDDIQKIGFGEAHRSWCRACHTLCNFVISAIRFQGDFSKTTQKDELAAKALPKPKKTVEKNVGIVVGQPLPDLGTCLHYKKSYRWFRFPCCGKVYPCDECHNLKEKDHEMKLANRMICGHCSTEQPFMKNKPCANCENNVTRTKSQFWEGGKGCRDQTLMRRNDARKHTNSRKKTVSNKKVGLLVVKKKT